MPRKATKARKKTSTTTTIKVGGTTLKITATTSREPAKKPRKLPKRRNGIPYSHPAQ